MPSFPALAGVGHHARRLARYGLVPTFWVLGTTIIINDYLAEITWIDGGSMSPTLSPTFHETGRGDWILWKKWDPTAGLQRGDLVHFGSPDRPECNAVKRVIAVEGDAVVLDPRRRPRRFVNGEDVPETRLWDAWRGKARVPKGHVWVEGDNWRKSYDSNYYGPISKSLITGRAVSVVSLGDRFWTRPWEGFKSRTKAEPGPSPNVVKEGDEMLLKDTFDPTHRRR